MKLTLTATGLTLLTTVHSFPVPDVSTELVSRQGVGDLPGIGGLLTGAASSGSDGASTSAANGLTSSGAAGAAASGNSTGSSAAACSK